MGDHNKRGNSSLRRRHASQHAFKVIHQAKQRLLLRALNEMSDRVEAPDESRAVAQMASRLEELLARRQRVYALTPKPRAKHRKRCAYGSANPATTASCDEEVRRA